MLMWLALAACTGNDPDNQDANDPGDGNTEAEPQVGDSGGDEPLDAFLPGAFVLQAEGVSDPSSGALGEALTSIGAREVERVATVPGAWRFASDSAPAAVQSALEVDDVVQWAEPVINVQTYAATPDDTYFEYQWHMAAMGAPDVWDLATGDGVVVAVVDTGLDAGFDGFDNVVDGWDAVLDEPFSGIDSGTHGTHVAGTVAQSSYNSYGTVGLAYNATIMPVRVLGERGGTSVDVAEGIRWAVDNGAQVINLSLGSNARSAIIADACQYAVDNGVVLVAASGNDGFEDFIGYPAALDTTIAVGATRYDDGISYYSNGGDQLTVVAPGGDTSVDQNGDGYADGVLQEIPDAGSYGFTFYQGTSMATPHVAALVAMIIEAGVTDPDDILTILREESVDLGDPGWDPAYGYGLIDPVAALERALEGGEPEPEPTTCGADLCAEDLTAADLRLTEVLPNPGDCSDATGEWIEVVNLTDGTIDINGLELEDKAGNTDEISATRALEPGEHAVLGRTELQSFCGPEALGAFGDVSLNNSNEILTLRFGERVIDQMSYGRSAEDESLSLPIDAYADGTDEDWVRVLPTPGRAYDPNAPTVLTLADLSSGDLRITELMADPAVCSDNNCEWLEIENRTTATVELQGLVVGDNSTSRGELTESVEVEPGARIVLGRGNADGWAHPGFTPDGFYGSSPSYNNSGDQVWVSDADGVRLGEMAAYSSTTAGASLELVGDDPLDINDWATATAEIPGGDFGTPGE
ncbi:MAG: S8 family serine peptidase [Myxococcota bacterium]